MGVVAPGFAVRREVLAAGVRRIERMGHPVVLGKSVLARRGYFAGDDVDRADDLSRMLRDRTVRGVWFARGGFGTSRLLHRIDWDALRADPKVLIGYSDVTALFSAVARHAPQPCLYGPVVADLGDPRSYHRRSLEHLLRGSPVEVPLADGQVLRHGEAEGTLVGGNLTVLVHLLGTPDFPPLDGRILFLEDTPESTYRLDRMLTQLRGSGALHSVKGVLLGALSAAPSGRSFPPDRRLGELLAETFLDLRVPVVRRLPAGHVPGKRTLPLGGVARIETRAGVVRLAVSPR